MWTNRKLAGSGRWMYRMCVCLWAQQSGSIRKATVFVASSPRDIHSEGSHLCCCTSDSYWIIKMATGRGASMNLCEALSRWWMLVISRKQGPSTQLNLSNITNSVLFKLLYAQTRTSLQNLCPKLPNPCCPRGSGQVSLLWSFQQL